MHTLLYYLVNIENLQLLLYIALILFLIVHVHLCLQQHLFQQCSKQQCYLLFHSCVSFSLIHHSVLQYLNGLSHVSVPHDSYGVHYR